MEIKKERVGLYKTNCYALIKNNKSIIIDPGFSPERIEMMIKDTDILAILLTHGHMDHISAVKYFYKKYNLPIYLSKKEDALLKLDAPVAEGYYRNFDADYLDLKEGILKIDDFAFEIIETPGHTAGSVIIRYENNLFTGDTLFRGTIGRTDVFSSDPFQMQKSIEKIKKLDPNYIIYPGHSESSTLKNEFLYNPFYQ